MVQLARPPRGAITPFNAEVGAEFINRPCLLTVRVFMSFYHLGIPNCLCSWCRHRKLSGAVERIRYISNQRAEKVYILTDAR